MPSSHFYRSLIVTSIVIALFALFVRENSKFKITDEYQIVPESFTLPHGCDIRIDMQSGETWAKRSKKDSSPQTGKSLVSVDPEPATQSKPKSKAYPEYKNVTKNRIQARLSSESFSKLESALNSLDNEESWEYLEEEGPAMEFGLAVFESNSFPLLRKKLSELNLRAFNLVATCLQNNPLAIEKFIELKVHSTEIFECLLLEHLEASIFKKVLRILESFDNQELNVKCKDHIIRHAQFHELSDRDRDYINLLLQ